MKYFAFVNGKGAIMACVRSPKWSDGELLAYLAGEADPKITAHLDECNLCRQRAATLAKQERQLRASLYRSQCPPSLTLSEYHIGFLSAAETRTIDRHLQQCPHCRHEIQRLTAYLTAVSPTLDLEPSPTLWERSRILVARLVDELPNLNALTGWTTGSTLAAAGLRGESGDQLVYAVADVQVILDVQTDAQHPAQRMLLGLLLGLAEPQNVTANLWRADQPVATTMVDALGNFIIAALVPGTYDLILSDDKTEVHVQALVV